MKQIIPFKKDLPFSTKISEITSISLENTLKLEKNDYISGEFIVSGDYKITDVSINLEPFVYNVPFDITLDTKYNIDKVKIDIDDFYYEIINDEILRVNIDVLVDGIEILSDNIITKEETYNREDNDMEEYIKDDIVDVNEEDLRDDMTLFKEVEIPATPVMGTEINEEKIKSLFDSFDENDETFTTYHVHIVRQEDTIETIIAKYGTTKEELQLYNKIEELKIGDKIIVPAHSNE